MAKSAKPKKTEQQPSVNTEEVITEPILELTDEQKIINYIENSHSEKVDLVPLLKSLYPLPIYTQPAIWLEQGESKKIKTLIGKMVSEGKITMADENYKKLGKHFYIDNDTKTKYHNIESLKIIAIK